MALPDRGDLVWVDFDPQAGHEQAEHRPAIVLTTEAYHRRSRLAIVCPITTQAKGRSTEVPLPIGLSITGVVLIEHIKSIDREARNLQVAGRAPQQVLDEIDARLAPLLSL